jgi:hypothetical protein
MLDTSTVETLPLDDLESVDDPPDHQAGFILVWAALMFFVLIIMAGFAVDLGSWYLRAQQVQRAADAAALSGVTLLPGTPAAAVTQAQVSAGRNGFLQPNGSLPASCSGSPHPSVCMTALQDTDPAASGATGNPYQLDVTVEDNHVPAYFTSFFIGPLSIKRTAHAEFAQPIPLGSPENVFGTGNIPGIGRGYWAAINGYCAAKEEGDRYASAFDGNVQTGGSPSGPIHNYTLGQPYGSPPGSCVPGTVSGTNVEYSPPAASGTSAPQGGYIFDVSVSAAPVGLDVYDPYYTVNNTGQTVTDRSPDRSYSTDSSGNLNANVTTLFTVYDPSFTQVCQFSYGANNTASVYKQWFRLCNLTSTGLWRVQVSTPADLASQGAKSFGGNSFALAAEATPQVAINGAQLATQTLTACTTLTGSSSPPYSATCPQIYGESAISLLVDSQSPQTDSGNAGRVAATFYLAQIQAAQAGKNLTLELWDPGDLSAAVLAQGAPYIQVLDNNGNPINFTYLVPPTNASKGIPPSNTPLGCDNAGLNPSAANTKPCNSQTLNGKPALDVSGTVAKTNNRYGTGIYNDDLVQLFVTVPTNYCQSTCANGGWWQIKYTFPGGGTIPPLADRTTWRVIVNGDPVHLLP